MDNRRVAEELVKLAKELSGSLGRVAEIPPGLSSVVKKIDKAIGKLNRMKQVKIKIDLEELAEDTSPSELESLLKAFEVVEEILKRAQLKN